MKTENQKKAFTTLDCKSSRESRFSNKKYRFQFIIITRLEVIACE